jgi:hypothetical protein
MPARKAGKKAATKKYSPKAPIVALYAVPIYAAIKRGDLAEMKALAATARKHISDVTSALRALEAKLKK